MKQENSGIWAFSDLLPSIPLQYRTSISEGSTSTKEIDEILFKCEFENPSGSLKDRGIAFQVSKLRQNKIKKAVIPSSGNAAISAANYCNLVDIQLSVFVGNNINQAKLSLLQKQKVSVVQTARPISSSIKEAQKPGVYSLRQSTDPNGYYGYQTISFELLLEYPEIDAIFLPVSSGSTLLGIATGYIKKGKLPAIHAVQTEAVNPIACLFDKTFTAKKTSIADSIVARYLPRFDRIVNYINQSHGWGWVISDNEMKMARKRLKKMGIDCSYEGAASYAAVKKAERKGKVYRHPVCLLTGRSY